MNSKHHGFTLIELLISLAILGIIIVFSMNSYQNLMANQALVHQAEQVYYTLQLAKSEAIKRNKKIYVHFCEEQSVWKMGMTELASCDCFTAHSCQLDGVDKVYDLADGKNLFINSNSLTFTGSQASYGPLRFSVVSGTLTITNRNLQSLSIIQSAMRLRICSENEPLSGYVQC